MEQDFFYGEKYYYENLKFEKVIIRFFFFNFQENIEEQLDFIKQNSINGISISNTEEKNVLKIIDFLIKEKIGIKLFKFQKLTLKNINFLYYFPEITSLTLIIECFAEFNFKKLDNLKQLNVFYHKNFDSLFEVPKITDLTIHKLTIKNSEKFKSLTQLIKISVSQSNLSEIDAFSDLKNLKEITLSYFPKLISIKPLSECKKTTSISLHNCKKISDWEILDELINLESVVVENCGELESVNFLEYLPIKSFYLIGNTKIKDGNLNFLLKKNIDLNFPVFKHYNLKPQDLWEYQSQREINKNLM